MVKWQASVTRRFLKESDNETDELDTEPGKEKEKDLDFLPENFIIASVILIVIFSLNLFSVTQDQYVINMFLHREEEVRDLMRGADFWSCKSSVYE